MHSWGGAEAGRALSIASRLGIQYRQGSSQTESPMPTLKPRVFISFDIDNDLDAKTMLAGQAKHDDSPFDFKDASVKDRLPGDWKEKVKRRMDNIDVVVVLCGEKTHTARGVAAELEIAREKKKPYFLLAAYSDNTCTKPTTALASDKVYRWSWDNLKALIHGGR